MLHKVMRPSIVNAADRGCPRNRWCSPSPRDADPTDHGEYHILCGDAAEGGPLDTHQHVLLFFREQALRREARALLSDGPDARTRDRKRSAVTCWLCESPHTTFIPERRALLRPMNDCTTLAPAGYRSSEFDDAASAQYLVERLDLKPDIGSGYLPLARPVVGTLWSATAEVGRHAPTPGRAASFIPSKPGRWSPRAPGDGQCRSAIRAVVLGRRTVLRSQSLS